MSSDQLEGAIVHVLLRQDSQYVETSNDAVSTSSMVLVDVFASEEDAKQYLNQNVREPLHRKYEIKEREVQSFE